MATRLSFSSLSVKKTESVVLSTIPQLLVDAKRILASPTDFVKVYLYNRSEWFEVDNASNIEKDDILLFLTATERLPIENKGKYLHLACRITFSSIDAKNDSFFCTFRNENL
jgi:hypothetical protein